MLRAQSLGSHAPPAVATGGERLLIEQVEELAKSKQFEDAVGTLEKLFEQSEGRLIEAESTQRAATQTIQRYVPIRQWSQTRLARLLVERPELRPAYLKNHDDAAAAALAEIQSSKDVVAARKAAERFSQSSSGVQLQLVLADSVSRTRLVDGSSANRAATVGVHAVPDDCREGWRRRACCER